MRWPWYRKLREGAEAVRAAEELRDRAVGQRDHARQDVAPRVDAVASSLRQLRTENHFGPMIDRVLRGG